MLAVPLAAASMRAEQTGFKRVGAALRVAFEIQDLFNDRFRRAIDGGGTLYVRVEVELWEAKGVWDRLVRPAAVSIARLSVDPDSRSLVMVDSFGVATVYPSRPRSVAVWADLVPTARVDDGKKYYVHASITVGTIAEDEISGVSSAIFGGSPRSSGLGALGKFVVQRVLRLADYLDSNSCEARSRPVSGAEMKKGAGSG